MHKSRHKRKKYACKDHHPSIESRTEVHHHCTLYYFPATTVHGASTIRPVPLYLDFFALGIGGVSVRGAGGTLRNPVLFPRLFQTHPPPHRLSQLEEGGKKGEVSPELVFFFFFLLLPTDRPLKKTRNPPSRSSFFSSFSFFYRV